MHFIKPREIGLQRFAQRIIQRVDRTVALGSSIEAVTAYAELNEGLGDYRLAGIFFNKHLKGFKDKQLVQLTGCFTQQQFQGGIGAFKLIALMFKILNLVNDFAGLLTGWIKTEPHILGFGEHIALAG
ncbi:hypothetical protein D3C81_1467080 [compost metagenome]